MGSQSLEKLKGYKTYITAVVAIVVAAGAYLTEEQDLATMIEQVFAIVMGVTIRAGIGGAK